MKKINICFHINNISNCGGTEKVTTQIASLLLDNYDDFNITILSDYYDEKKGPFFIINKNIKYDRLFDEPIKSFKKVILQLIKKEHDYIKNNNIDILIGVDMLTGIYDLPAKIGTKTKYIAWEHFNFYSNLGIKIRDISRKLCYKYANKVVVLTKKDRENYIKELGNNDNIIQIYNPYNFNKSTSENYLKSSKKYILSSGRLTDQKGFDILIQVAKKMKEDNQTFLWKILGDGEDKNKLLEKVKEYGLEKNVVFIGKVKNVNKYYKDAALFVLTSRYEGLGLVLLEAKSFGLPVISFDCNCGPSELVENNVNGYLIDNFSINEMASKIEILLNNNKKCISFSKKSLLNMEQFSNDNVIKKWYKIINQLMGGK